MTVEGWNFYESQYNDYDIVLTKHAKKRMLQIDKSEYFIQDKLKSSRLVNKSVGRKYWEWRRYGISATTWENGDYQFICKVNDKRKQVIIITVINLSLRKEFEKDLNGN